MRDVELLDCTLRDGAHVVSGNFKHDCIIGIMDKLVQTGYEIIEFGFLKNVTYDPDKTFFPKIEIAHHLLNELKSKDNHQIKFSLMVRADEYDISYLTPCTGAIEILRVAFYQDRLSDGITFAKHAMELGYKCSLNLINTPGSTFEELKSFVDKANALKPYAVSIVDTFGVMDLKELTEIVHFYEMNLDSSIRLGLHIHENLSLAFALAQKFLCCTNVTRKLIIDSSLMGIGRAPGNLCTELITHYMNSYYGKNYNTRLIAQAIQEHVKPFKNSYKWGYAPEYMLSAKYRVHRSYAEFLEKKGISLDEIDLILSLISQDNAKKFNESIVYKIMKDME